MHAAFVTKLMFDAVFGAGAALVSGTTTAKPMSRTDATDKIRFLIVQLLLSLAIAKISAIQTVFIHCIK